MFTWLNKQGVRSSAGFEVQSVDRFAVEYREAGQVVTVAVEPGSFGGQPSITISPRAFERFDGASQCLSLEEQARMRANFCAAMQFQGVTVEP